MQEYWKPWRQRPYYICVKGSLIVCSWIEDQSLVTWILPKPARIFPFAQEKRVFFSCQNNQQCDYIPVRPSFRVSQTVVH